MSLLRRRARRAQVATWIATAIDDRDPSPTVTCNPVSGSVFPLGSTTVICTGRDAANNTSSGSFPVNVIDVTAPSASLIAPAADAILGDGTVAVTVEATDLVGVASVSVNDVPASLATGNVQAGTWTVNVPIGSAAGTSVEFHIVARDASANTATVNTTIDNDGIDAVVDRSRDGITDLSGVYSSDFANDVTVGTVLRNGWTARVERNADAVLVTASGAGDTLWADLCSGTPKHVALNTDGERAEVICAETGSVTVRALSTPNAIEVYKRLSGSCPNFWDCTEESYWQTISLASGEVTTGSPVTAAASNVNPIQITLLHVTSGGAVPVGSFVLDPGESADPQIVPGSNGSADEIRVEVLTGTVTVEVQGQTQTVGAGEVAVFTLDEVLDTIAPMAQPSASPAPGSGGWNMSAVTITWNWSDAGSGLDPAQCESSSTASENGVVTISATCADRSGNVGHASHTVKIDAMPPTVDLIAPGSGASYVLNSAVTISFMCADQTGLSGVQSCVGTAPSGGLLDTASVGLKTFTVTARDHAGHITTRSVSYRVQYGFEGFFNPVDNLPVVNLVNAGRAIPVKFALGGNQGLNILAGAPTSVWVSCNDGAPLDEVEQTLTAGTSTLSYDAATGQYQYVWKTEKTWQNSCRQLTITLADGTAHSARFKFR